MLRRLLISVLVVALSSALGAGSFWFIGGKLAIAEEQDNKNCPSGFFWERMSGQCCVQDRSTLPAHGKIGYTGNSLCEDGWYDVYERRPTTDGLGPPGCPGYTSYPFLVRCVSSADEARQQQAAIDAKPTASAGETGASPSIGAPSNPVSEALHHSGGTPSRGTAAAGGLLAGGLIGVIIGSTFLASPVPIDWKPPGTPEPSASEPPRAEELRDENGLTQANRDALDEAIAQARAEEEEIAQQLEEAEQELKKWKDIAKPVQDSLYGIKESVANLERDVWWAQVGGYSFYVAGGAAVLAAALAAMPAAAAAATAAEAGLFASTVARGASAVARVKAFMAAVWKSKWIFTATQAAGTGYNWTLYNTSAFQQLLADTRVLEERVVGQLWMANQKIVDATQQREQLTEKSREAWERVRELMERRGTLP
jgi:cell division septum initiation protein DivIVA